MAVRDGLSGYNYRLPDINCALGLSQLKKLVGNLERRHQIARRYDEPLAALAGVALPREREDRVSAWHL